MHDLDRETANLEGVPVRHPSIRACLSRLLAERLNPLRQLLLVLQHLDVLRHFRLPVLQEVHLLAVQHHLRARFGPQLRGAARVIKVVVRQHDPTHLHAHLLPQELHPRLHRLLVPKPAVDQRPLASVMHEEHVRRLRPRVERRLRRNRVDVLGNLHS